ncbi:PLP-dependent aminotransferase family protein [bacterium]|nr:PLP-dependent aminotransferase family protein [bacterium]
MEERGTKVVQENLNLYQAIAGDIAQLITNGTLRPGDRVPSIRTLSRQQRVSPSTINQAYFLLERQGLIEARERSGFYVSAPASPSYKPFSILSETYAGPVTVRELITQVLLALRDPELLPLGAGTPSLDLLPLEKMARITAKVCQDQPELVLAYDFAPGSLELRRQIARYSAGFGCAFSPDDLIITSGGIEALNLCLRAVARPGDAIAIESPTYFGVLEAIESLGMHAVEIPTHPETGISLPDLEQALNEHKVKACLVMPTFNNPLGSVMSDQKKRELVELLGEREIPLIEDDIYGDLSFDGTRPKPCKAYDTRGLVLLCGSFSKTIGPGLRVGWCTPGRFLHQVVLLKGVTTLATPGLQQVALARFLEQGGYQRLLKGLRSTFQANLFRTHQVIAEAFPVGTKVTHPTGGFLLWVELPEGVDAVALHREALAAGISITPGPIFSASGNFQNCIRLNCANSWSERIEAGLRQLGAIAQRLAASR